MLLSKFDRYYTYKTIQGDTFDSISLDFYNEEKYANLIIQANPSKSGIIVFDPDVELIIPVIDIAKSSSLPPWRQNSSAGGNSA